MSLLTKGYRAAALGAVLLLSACGQRAPVTVYVIRPPAGQGEVSMEDKDKLRATLDAFAAQYGMEKAKPGQANIIRYYPPTAHLQIGFYAASDNKRVTIYASPLNPTMGGDKACDEFRQALEARLRDVFDSQLSVELPPQP